MTDEDFPLGHLDPPELNDLGLPAPEVPADWELPI